MIISTGRSDQRAGLQLERGPGFPHWTAGFFFSGETEIAYADRTYLLRAQHCLITPPNTPYRLQVRRRERETWMLFDPRPEWVPFLRNAKNSLGVSFVPFREKALWNSVRSGLDDLMRWWGAHPPEVLLAENALERVLLLARKARDADPGELLDGRLKRVTDFVEKNLHQPLRVDGLARVAALSDSRLAHVFRERMGLTLMQYVESRRIERSKQLLLDTDLSIKEVGVQTGFPNAEHFSVRFRKCAGQSPTEFRSRPQRRFAELNPEQGGAAGF